MPSVYHSCTVDNAATEAMSALKQHLEDVHQQFNQQLAVVAAAFADLEGDPVAASVTMGTTPDNQITWTAQNTGRQGNQINITYAYLGPVVDDSTSPPTILPRWSSSTVQGNTITLYLGSDANGVVTAFAWVDLFLWLSNTDVTDLVQGALVGTGTVPNVISDVTVLAGGKDRSVTQSESAANEVAEVFGQKNYRTFLKSLDIPVIETAADATQYIQTGDEYCVVNGKLLVIDGTNLVAINRLYRIMGQDLQKTKQILANMTTSLPTLLTTQNVTTTTYEIICNVAQPVAVVAETYRNVDTNINTTIAVHGGALDSLHHYIFWGEQVNTTQPSYDALIRWGMPEEYVGDILSNTSPDQEPWLYCSAPEVLLIENLALLQDLKFTDAELEELLALGVDGIKIPHRVPMQDRVDAVKRVLARKPRTRGNGMRNRVKAPIVAAQVIDVAKVTDDQNLAKELATRGKACARSTDRLDPDNLDGYNIPDLDTQDFPNIPYDQLPDPAKKIESAFGALSGSISFANRLFDLMIGSLTKMVSGILNKIQNIASLTDNLFGNSLMGCLLGTSGQGTGVPEFTSVGAGGGNSIPAVTGILGGLPLPMSLLKEAFKMLSIELDETITAAFETLMGLIRVPLCIVQNLLSSLSGFDLGGFPNPCKDGSDPDALCPPEDVQSVIDQSTDLTNTLGTIPSLEDAVTTLPQTVVEETIEDFTGLLKKTVTESVDAVTRGIQEVMDEITQSVDSKIEVVEQLDKAIQELFGDARDTQSDIDREAAVEAGCAPAVLGLFTDAVGDFL